MLVEAFFFSSLVFIKEMVREGGGCVYVIRY